MADLIDRDELKKRYSATAQSGGYSGDAMSIVTNHLTRLLRLIDDAPTVEPKKGKWIVLDDYSRSGIYCSSCRNKIYDSTHQLKKKLLNYCPNCGADMRGESE